MYKKAGFTFASRAINAILNFALIVWISHLLGPEVRGKCAFYQIIIVIIVGISEIAGGAVTAFLMQRFHSVDILRIHGKWVILPVILVPLIFFIGHAILPGEMALLMLGGWFHCKWNMQQHVLLALQKFDRFNASIILAPMLSLTFFGAFALLGFLSEVSYLVSLFSAWAVLYVLSFIFLRETFSAEKYHKRPLPSFRDLAGPGLLNQLAHIVALLNNRLIFFLFPAAQLGLWSNTLTLAEALLLVPGSLGQVIYAQLASKSNLYNPIVTFKKASGLNLALMGGGIIIPAALPDSIWSLVFGRGFTGLRDLLVIILPGLGFYSFYILITYVQSARGRFLLNLVPLMAGLLLNLGATYWLKTNGNYSLSNAISILSVSWFFVFALAILLFFLNTSHQPSGTQS